MKDQINIREANRQDVPILAQFSLQIALETEDRQLDKKVVTCGVNSVFDDPKRGFYLVAEVEDKIAGSLMVTTEWSEWQNGDFWWIQSVHVEPEFRRRGIFKALYTEAKRRAKNTAEVRGCRLYVERDNTAAQATYAQLGFVETTYKMFEELFPEDH